MSAITSIWDHVPPASVLIAISVLISSYYVYHVFFGPLSKFPGPLIAKFSSLWIVFQCRKTKLSDTVLQQHRKYGTFVRISPNHISISDREALETIYGHKSGFTKGPFYEDNAPFHQVEPVLFNTRDTKIHQRKKRYLSPAFSARSLGNYEPHMSELIGKLMVSLNQHVQGPGQTIVDFNEYLNYLAFDVIGDYAFGKPFGFLDREKDHLNLIATIDARGEVLNALGHLPQFVRPMMKCFVMDPFWPNGLRATSNLATFGTSAFCQRRDQQNSRKDLLSFLFEAVDPDSGLPLTEKEIIAESISFIVGGSDTTSSTMTNVVDIVSRLPDIQNKLQEELDREFPSQVAPDWAADYKTINQLPVLNAVVRETMRFRPTSSTGLERVTPKGGKIIAGKFIPEDTLVSVPTLNIHHDPGVFADPGQFDISRWLNDSSPELLDSFYPFSLGPRACIGRNFAWMEMLKTLATIFKVYRIERAHLQDTQVREGFFVKNSECRVTVKWRSPSQNK